MPNVKANLLAHMRFLCGTDHLKRLAKAATFGILMVFENIIFCFIMMPVGVKFAAATLCVLEYLASTS